MDQPGAKVAQHRHRISHVILATDGSAGAAVGERLVAGIAWPAGTTITVLSVVPVLLDALGTSWAPLAG